MNVGVIEEFFGSSFHKSGSIYSLEFISNEMVYYVELDPPSNSMVFTASNKCMKPAYPLFEYEIICDHFTIATEVNGSAKLNLFMNGEAINTISVIKDLGVFSIVASL